MRRASRLIPLLLALTTACSAPPPAAPLPPPAVLLTTPAWEPIVADWLSAFNETHSPGLIRLETMPLDDALQALADGEAAALISTAEPQAKWFATPMARLDLALIVPRNLKVSDLDLAQAAQVFAGTITSWDELDGPALVIQPVIPPLEGEMWGRFSAAVMRGRPPANHALIAPDPSAMVTRVASESGAIGIAPAPLVPDALSTVRLAGERPEPGLSAADGYPIAVRLLAIAPQEPTGVLHDFLAWVQAGSPQPSVETPRSLDVQSVE